MKKFASLALFSLAAIGCGAPATPPAKAPVVTETPKEEMKGTEPATTEPTPAEATPEAKPAEPTPAAPEKTEEPKEEKKPE